MEVNPDAKEKRELKWSPMESELQGKGGWDGVLLFSIIRL